MANTTFFYSILIREAHLDTFGHVNNAKYLQIFEEARWDFITANGYGLAEIQKCQQSPIMLEVHLKWKRELRLRETIRIESSVVAYRKKIGILRQKILNSKGELAAVADFTFGLFDTQIRKLIIPTEAWQRALGIV